MAATTPTTTRALDLADVDSGGLVAEDVMNRLFKLTPVERPFIDSVGSGDAKAVKKEFVDKVLAKPSSTNSFAENEDLTARNDSRHGLRYYNLCQQMGKVIKTSQRGRDVELVYGGDDFLQQLMDAGEELRMDEEAAVVSRNAATAEIGTAKWNPATPAAPTGSEAGSLMAGACTWASLYVADLGTGGVAAVLDGAGTPPEQGGGPTTAPTPPTAGRAMTETMLRDILRLGWVEGAKYSLCMSTGDMIETIGNYMFTSSARVATLQSEVPQSNRTGVTAGNGARQGGVVAQGAVNMFVGNFGVVTLTPNRQMELYDIAGTDCADVLFVDTRYPVVATLHGYGSKDLAERGLYDQQVLFCDKTLIPGATRSLALIQGVNPATPMTA